MTKADLQREAGLLGFDLCRVAAPGVAPHSDALHEWLHAGQHGTMEWMRRTEADRADPRRLLQDLRSIVVLAASYYRSSDDREPGTDLGRVARYARGDDYHDVLAPKLRALAASMSEAGGQQKWFVDSGPMLERDWAAASGISWHGKSTMGINPRLGTWFFICVILTTLEFPPDPPQPDRCGRCTKCISACPTGAIVAPHRLDARRCVSYLTIENKGPIPLELRRAVGDRIFGCDDCLEACPWNRFARDSRDTQLFAKRDIWRVKLREFLSLDDAGFKELFRGSPILRAKRRGMLRNVCVALGNKGNSGDLPALRRASRDHEPLVREHAMWAIEEIEARERASSHQPRCSTESR